MIGDAVLWGFVAMAAISLVGGWFARRALKKVSPDVDKLRQSTTKSIVKVSFVLLDDEVEVLKRLADKRGITATEVLRAAIAVEDANGRICELVFR